MASSHFRRFSYSRHARSRRIASTMLTCSSKYTSRRTPYFFVKPSTTSFLYSQTRLAKSLGCIQNELGTLKLASAGRVGSGGEWLDSCTSTRNSKAPRFAARPVSRPSGSSTHDLVEKTRLVSIRVWRRLLVTGSNGCSR